MIVFRGQSSRAPRPSVNKLTGFRFKFLVYLQYWRARIFFSTQPELIASLLLHFFYLFTREI